jgi:hypothetical protein
MAETNSTTNHNVSIDVNSNVKTVNQQFKEMVNQLSGTAKAAAVASRAFKGFSEATGLVKGLIGQIVSLSGATLGLKSSIDIFHQYNKAIVTLGVQFSKYGKDIIQTEFVVKSLSNKLGIQRMEVIGLMKAYERVFPYASLEGGKKLLTNIQSVVGTNVEAIGEMQSALASLVDMYPALQQAAESFGEADKQRISATITAARMMGKISVEQYKKIKEYVSKQMTPEGAAEEQRRKKQIEDMEKLKQLWNEVALIIGTELMPYMQKFAQFLQNNRKEIEFWAKTVAKVVPHIVVIAAAFKAIVASAKVLSTLGALVSVGTGVKAAVQGGGGVGGGVGGALAAAMSQRGSSPANPVFTLDVMKGIGGAGIPGTLPMGAIGQSPAVNAMSGMAAQFAMAAAAVAAFVAITGILVYELYELDKELKEDAKAQESFTKTLEMSGKIQDKYNKIAPEGRLHDAQKYYKKHGGSETATRALEVKENLSLMAKEISDAQGEAFKAAGTSIFNPLGIMAKRRAAANYQKVLARNKPKMMALGQDADYKKFIGSQIAPYQESVTYRTRRKYMSGQGADVYNDLDKARGRGADGAAEAEEIEKALLSVMEEETKLLTAQVGLRTSVGQKVSAVSKTLATVGESEDLKAEFSMGVNQENAEITKERSLLLSQLTNKQSLLVRLERDYGKDSQIAKEAKTGILDLQTKIAEKSQNVLDNLMREINLRKEIADLYRSTAGSGMGALSSYSTAAQLAGPIGEKQAQEIRDFSSETVADLQTAAAKTKDEIASISQAMSLGEEAMRGQYADMLRAKGLNEEEVKNKMKSVTYEKMLTTFRGMGLQASQKLYDTQEQINTVQSVRLQMYNVEAQKQAALTSLAEAQVNLMDNLITGLGASVEMRMKAVDAVKQEREVQQKIISEFSRIEAEFGTLNEKQRTEKLQAQQKIVDLTQKEANLLRQIRDGWTSAITAMTIGSGRIAKIKISSDQNMRQSLQFYNSVRSAMSGAVARPGEKNLGFREGERFVATAGGGISIAGGRTEGMGYKPDYGIPMSKTNEMLYGARGGAFVTAKQFGAEVNRMQGNMRGKSGGGMALGVQAQPSALSATVAPTIGSGTQGVVAGGGVTITFQINGTNKEQVLSIITQKLKEVFNDRNVLPRL